MRAVLAILMIIVVAGVGLAQRQDTVTKPSTKAQHHHSEKAMEMPKHMQHMNDMMVKHLGKNDREYERRFIDVMIPHHEGAILASEHALKHANRDELKEMAKKAIKEQKKEIEQLKEWRQEWYGEK